MCLFNMQTQDREVLAGWDLHLPSDCFPSPSAQRGALGGSGAANNNKCPLRLYQSLIFALHLHICVWIINQPAVMA